MKALTEAQLSDRAFVRLWTTDRHENRAFIYDEVDGVVWWFCGQYILTDKHPGWSAFSLINQGLSPGAHDMLELAGIYGRDWICEVGRIAA